MIRTTGVPDIGTEGLRVLRDRLGPSGMLEFLQIVRGGSGDYTGDRARLFDHLSVQQIAREITENASGGRAADWRIEIVDEARRVARLPEAQQNAWLMRVREALATHPNLDRIIEGIRGYMQAAGANDEARLRETHAEEMMEADAFCKLEGLLNRSLALPSDRSEALRVLAYIAIVGHFLPHLRQRLERPDAQEYLKDQLGHLLAR